MPFPFADPPISEKNIWFAFSATQSAYWYAVFVFSLPTAAVSVTVPALVMTPSAKLSPRDDETVFALQCHSAKAPSVEADRKPSVAGS